MALTTYFYTGQAVSLAEVQRTVEPTAAIVRLTNALVVSVTVDSSNKEQLDDIMARAGYTELVEQTDAIYRHTIDGFTQFGVAGSLLDKDMDRWNVAFFKQAQVLGRGWLRGVGLVMDVPASGGAITCKVFRQPLAGVPADTGLFCTIAAGDTQASATFASGAFALAKGDLLSLRLSTPGTWQAILANAWGTIDLES